MDFALFELDEDDDLLSAAYDQATQQQQQQPVATPAKTGVIAEFCCTGEDSLKSLPNRDDGGFVCNEFLRLSEFDFSHVELTSFQFRQRQLHSLSVLQFAFGDACLNIQYLLSSIHERGSVATRNIDGSANSLYKRRRQVTTFLQLLLATTRIERWSAMRASYMRLQRLLNNVLDYETWRLLYSANSPKGNNCQIPAYHALHGVLEWRLIEVCLLHKFEHNDVDELEQSSSLYSQHLERLLDDLLVCALLRFKQLDNVDIPHRSAFPCVCFKEIWLCLQLLLEKWSAVTMRSVGFWSAVNAAMKRFNNEKDKHSLTALTYGEFANWLHHSLVQLHGFNSSGVYVGPHGSRVPLICAEADTYEFWEQNVAQYLNAQPSEERLRSFICLIRPILVDWWRPRIAICMHLWEYMHKRLNTTFYATGSAPITLAIVYNSGRAHLEQYKKLLAQTQLNATLSSYTLFTLTLGNMLQRLQNAPQAHTQLQKKMLGRIYSKFSVQKFLMFSEVGIHQLIELLLMLCLSGDFGELVPKIREFLLSLSLEQLVAKKQSALMKGHVALLLLHAQQRHDFSSYVSKLLEQLAVIGHNDAVWGMLADSLTDICLHADDFARGEHLLIASWLTQYLRQSAPVEQARTLTVLHELFEKLHVQWSNVLAQNASFRRMHEALEQYVLPFVRTHFWSSEHALPLAQLAADFCIQATDVQKFQQLLAYFMTGSQPPANKAMQPTFLLNVLASKRSHLVAPTIIMQAWLKSLVLLSSQHDAAVALTSHASKLPEFKLLCELGCAELACTKEPLYAFVSAVGRRYESCTQPAQRSAISSKFNLYLSRFEQWLHNDLKNESAELVFRFYRFLAIVIFNCARLVYVKSQPQCFFHLAVTRFVLPTYIQMGKPPEGKLAQVVHKIWPVLVQGIGKLDFRADAYINKTLSDLILRWTPNFRISSNCKFVARPFSLCLACDNQDLAVFMLERLSSMFLATQRRQADSNACLVVSIFKELVAELNSHDDADYAESRLTTFMQANTMALLEHIMMVDELVPSRGLLLTLFKTIVQSALFQRSTKLKAMLPEHLRLLAKKHLSYYTFFYFELINKLAEFSPEIVLEIMEFLRTEIRNVEAKRGTGEDKHIRGCFQKLQAIVTTAKRRAAAVTL